jgi:hypothetical protein
MTSPPRVAALHKTVACLISSGRHRGIADQLKRNHIGSVDHNYWDWRRLSDRVYCRPSSRVSRSGMVVSKMLGVRWDKTGSFKVVVFKPGEWGSGRCAPSRVASIKGKYHAR